MKTILASLILGALLASPQLLRSEETGVLILLGAKDKEPTTWDGGVELSAGKVAEISGWRFAQGDRILKGGKWKCSTRNEAIKGRASNPKKIGQMAKANRLRGPMSDNGIVLRLQEVDDATEVKVTTEQGNFSFKLGELAYGKRAELLDGRVFVQRTASGRRLSLERTDDDYPAIAMDEKHRLFITWQSFTPGIDRDERAKRWDSEPADLSFLAKPAGGDQLFLTVREGQKFGEPIAVTDKGHDIYRSAVTSDGKGGAWVFWADRKKDNFEILGRHFTGGQLGEEVNLSNSPGNDVSPVATTDGSGTVWVAWQGVRDGVFQIQARTLTGDAWGQVIEVSNNGGNCWTPAIASSKGSGQVAIAWDTYEKGDYDIWMREFGKGGEAAQPMAVANSPLYEARPTLTYDKDGALWIAWEKSGQTWGKDWGAYDGADGIGLYRERQIGLLVRKEGKWMEPVGALEEALPGAMAFSAARFNKGAPPVSPETEQSPSPTVFLDPAQRRGEPGKHAETKGWGTFNNIGRLGCGEDGRIWCLVRARQNNSRGVLGSVWMTAAAYLEGDHWVGPILVPHTENLIYNITAMVPGKLGMLLAHSTDHRVDRMGEFAAARDLRGKGGNAALDASKDPFDNDVYFSRLANPAGEAAPIALKEADPKHAPMDNPEPSQRTVAERAEVKACRDYRATLGGKELRILRGEFHRHTEISGDGGGDGPLEDMWRYAMDAASFDWIGNGDHDNGNGREYSWWLTQKTTDAFHIPGRFDPMFSYERSVSYPEGHRNCVFAQRGVRTLPRLPTSDPQVFAPAPDTTMLYKYLHLFGGVCASHTSVGTMGTDWRNNDPEVEPFVEVYQGARQNYEYPGCPRCPTEQDAIGGWEPAGFICNAFAKGYRMSFESSSDHGSTHISYAMIYAEEATREGILKAMKARHTYGATDNIIADVRCKAADGSEKMMGDEFAVKGAPTLDIKFAGTSPFSRVVIIKDNEEINITTPNTKDVHFQWTDPKPEAGKTSYYYVRGEQANSELVWASPMWIKSE